MVISLATTTRAARLATSHSVGGETFTMPAGKSLKIRTSPNGEKILDKEVPAGKSWAVRVDVSIAETDA